MSARPESFRSTGNVEGLRVPPQSVESEQAVIGGLLLSPESFDRIADLLTEADFYRRDHRLIYRGIVELHGKKKPFDAVTLGDWFEANGLTDQVGGRGYLIDLANTTPSAASIRAYAEIVKAKAQLRGLIEVGTDIVNTAFEPEGRDATEIIGEFTSKLGTLTASEPCELESMGPVLDRTWNNLVARSQREDTIDGLSTGFDELDRLLNGMKGGQLILIAGRPKMGKSTLANNIAEHAAVDLKQRVAEFNLEMAQEQVAGRMICSQSSVQHQRFRTGQMDPIDWERANDAMKRLKASPLHISKPKNARVVRICAQARRLHARKPLRLLILDYLQLVETSAHDNRAQGLGEVSRALKMLAIDLNIPVIALSQLSRKVEERPNKRPIPADLRDSGALEQDCDALLFVYRDEVYHKHSPDAGTCEIEVALQRDGPTGMVRVQSRLDVCRFENLPHDWEPRRPEKAEGEGRGRKARARLGDAVDGAQRAAGPDA